MNTKGKSDGFVVPTNRANKADAETAAESGEEREPTERNADSAGLSRTQKRTLDRSPGLARVREKARGNPELKFTSLLHHVDLNLLHQAFFALKKDAATGVDEASWREYYEHHADRLAGLHGRVHRGSYRAKPSKRIYIPKADGRKRPIGIASLEDKIVQKAVVWVLESIYENDFLGFSYGFRPGRGQHEALDSLTTGLTIRKVNWVIDADVQGFFDNVSHEWLMEFLKHRIADPRVLRLIGKWLRAGVSEDGEWSDTKIGTPPCS